MTETASLFCSNALKDVVRAKHLAVETNLILSWHVCWDPFYFLRGISLVMQRVFQAKCGRVVLLRCANQ